MIILENTIEKSLDQIKSKNLFDLSKSVAKDLFEKYEFPWEILNDIGDFIVQLGKKKYDDNPDFIKIGENIWISKDAIVDKNTNLTGPLIVESGAEIRYNAYVRGNVILDKGCILGHCCEIKNTILFENVNIPHFNYVGDSIFGANSHIGAGVIISNLRSDKKNVKINLDSRKIDTNMRKFGSAVGDYVEIGCNAVLNPGTIVGKNSSIYPTTMVRGVIENDSIVKNNGGILKKCKNIK